MNLTTIKDFLDPNHARYVTGTPEDRERARREWHRQRFIAQVMCSELEEIPRDDITPHRFGTVEDVRTGRLFRQRRDGLIDLDWTDANAYYMDPNGTPILLEPRR